MLQKYNKLKCLNAQWAHEEEEEHPIARNKGGAKTRFGSTQANGSEVPEWGRGVCAGTGDRAFEAGERRVGANTLE